MFSVNHLKWKVGTYLSVTKIALSSWGSYFKSYSTTWDNLSHDGEGEGFDPIISGIYKSVSLQLGIDQSRFIKGSRGCGCLFIISSIILKRKR